MTDNAITTLDPQAMLAQIQGLGSPDRATKSRMPLAKVSLLQSTSAIVKDPNNPAQAGQFLVTFDRDGITPPQLLNNLRIVVIDWFNGQVMYPFDENGKKAQGADVMPVCGSNDGAHPRLDYIGKTFTDYRRNKEGDYEEWTITDSCKDCPLGQWIPQYEFDRKSGELKTDPDGKPLIKRGTDGKPLNAKPPCARTTTYIVYLPDLGIPARLQVSGTVAGSIKKVADFFAKNQAGQFPHVIADENGVAVKTVTLEPSLSAYRDNSESWMIKFGWTPEPMTMEEAAKWISLARLYQEENIRETLTGNGFVDETNDAADPNEAADEAVTAAKSDVETAKGRLGSKKNSKRRLGEDAMEDPFKEDDDEE